ncbi:MAG: hypothetical protein ACE5HD_06450 [Acidobacteriota bacterium]
MKVNLEEGTALVLPEKEKSFDPAGIPAAVRRAGFTPGEIELIAVGRLGRQEDHLVLEMSGRKLILEGGKKGTEIAGRDDLLGHRVRVTGTLHAPHRPEPPGMSVEEWSQVKPGG